jgi:hypothetical protein
MCRAFLASTANVAQFHWRQQEDHHRSHETGSTKCPVQLKRSLMEYRNAIRTFPKFGRLYVQLLDQLQSCDACAQPDLTPVFMKVVA